MGQDGTEAAVTAGGGTGSTRPIIGSQYKGQGVIQMEVGAKAWSFHFNVLVPENNLNHLRETPDSVDKWVVQTLRDRLDSKCERKVSILQVRFRFADFIPGKNLHIHGWCKLESRSFSSVLRAWLRIDYLGSEWVPYCGSDALIDEAYNVWLSADDAAVIVDVWPLAAPGQTAVEAAAGTGFKDRGTVVAPAGDGGAGGGGTPASQTPVSTGAKDRLLLQACADAGIDPRRVLSVSRPDQDSAALKHFQAKGIELAAAGAQNGDFENPAGHKWVLLAMSGENQDQQYAEAARLFQPRDAGHGAPSQPSRVILASAEYSGVCVLAKALLGSGMSSYADGFEPRGQSQQQQDDFWIETCCSQTQTCHAGFQSPDQLLPIYMILMSNQYDDQDDNLPTPAKLRDSFSVPVKDCTDSNILHTELATLRIENTELQKENLMLHEKLARVRKKRKNETNAAGRSRRRDDVKGCQQVTIAQLSVVPTGLEGVKLVSEADSAVAALGGEGQAKKKPCRVQGEVAQDKLIVESKGGKAIRRAKSGLKIGGLEWKDSVMAGAVANWALYSMSFKAAGKTANAGLRIQGVRFWFKAEPLRNYKSRRRMGQKNSIPEIPLRDISTASMRDGVFAMELAKNSCFHQKLIDADAVALCADYGSVSDKSFQASHLRTFKFEKGGTDGADTTWLTVIADSMVLDVWPVGDKKLEVATYTDEAGDERCLPVEAPRALAAQLIYAGILWILMACRCLSLTFDGGGEGTGLGNKKRARETMAGEHSYLDLVWLKRSAADSAFEMLNKANLFVALMEFYGYDWEAGDFLTKRQDSQSSLAPVARAARRPSVRLDLTEGPESEEGAATAAARPPRRNGAKRPIFDPLGGQQDAAPHPMSFFDFVVWDIARAYPFLGLAETADCLTEDMVTRTESFLTCLYDAAVEVVVNPEIFCKTISADGFKRLQPGHYTSADAVSFVMEPMTLAMGGRLLAGKGSYTDAPTPSPLIQVASGAGKIYVLDTFAAQNMVNSYQEGNISKLTCFFQNRRDLSAGENPMALESCDTVFVCVHRPDHYVCMVVEHLGGSDGDTAAPRMTVADSCPSPSFNCSTHDALRTAFKRIKLIGKEQEVDHWGLALPQQTKPDCAFYMLIYLATALTGTLLPPMLWGILTRLMRCWTFFQLFRELLDNGSILDEAFRNGKREWERLDLTRPPAYAPAEDILGPVGYTETPVRLDISSTSDKDAVWMEAAEKAAEQARRKALAQEVQIRSIALGERASKAWKKMERERPRQLDTSGGVSACSTPPVCARASGDSEDNWRNRYNLKEPIQPQNQSHRCWPKDSMRNNPMRYFPMAEQDQRNPIPAGLWCGRHRMQCYSEDCSESLDNYSEIAEKCVTCVRNPFLWPRLKAHIQAYAGSETALRPDPIHKEVRKCMRLRVDRCGPLQGRMVSQKDSEAPSYHTGLVSRTKKCVFVKVQASAKTRWGTQLEGQWQLGVNGRVLASSLIQATGDGTLEALKKGAAAPFQVRGFQVDGSIRMSEKLGKHLRCLTLQKFNFYHAIGRFLCTFTTRPMLSAFSKDLECPAASVCGVSSYFRRLLRLVTDEMFVGLFNSADCSPKEPYRNEQSADRSALTPFTGTSHKFDAQTRKKKSADRPHSTVRLAHRGWASIRGSHKSLFLLNPNANVQGVLGQFTTPDMADGVRALICDLRRTAEMEGELKFLPTLDARWEARERARAVPVTNSNWSAIVAAGKDKAVVKAGATAAARSRTANAVSGAQYARNMHKAQWAVREIMHDVVRAAEKWFDHELYSLFGFLACMIQTRWVDVVKVQTGEKMKILIAHEAAIPNGQIGSRILDELEAHFRNQGEEQFLDFYPPQLVDMLKDEAAMRQFPEFLRGNAIQGFYLLDERGDIILEDVKPLRKDANGDNIKQPVVAGPAPLWRFPELARRALKLYFRQISSNDVERVLSLAARGYRGGGKNVGIRCINSWLRRRDWVSARFYCREGDPAFLEVYREARRLIRENAKGFQQVFTLDINTSELRNRWRQQKELPDYIKRGLRKFAKTNIEPDKQEFLAGSKQPTALVVSARKRRQQLAARLIAIKCSHVPRPRARTAVDPTGKRKRPETADTAAGVRKQRSKRGFAGRNNDADCMAENPPSSDDENSVPQLSGGGAVTAVSEAAAAGGNCGSHITDQSVQAAAGPVPAAAASAGGAGLPPAAAADKDPAAACGAASGAAAAAAHSGVHDSCLHAQQSQHSAASPDSDGAVEDSEMEEWDGLKRAKISVAGSVSGTGTLSNSDDCEQSLQQLSGRGAVSEAGGNCGSHISDQSVQAATGPVPAVAASAGGAGLPPAAAADKDPAAASGAAATHARGLDSNSHPLVIAMQKKMDTLPGWRPSLRVEVKPGDRREQYVFGMRRPEPGGKVHVVRSIESYCTLNLAYDPSDGIVKIIKICSTGKAKAKTKHGSEGSAHDETGNSLYMEYYFVYPNERAQLEAEFQDDADVTFLVNGIKKTSKQCGANTLRAKASQWEGVALHHSGDICHASTGSGAMNLGNIVGTIAWVTAESLMHKGKICTNLQPTMEKELSRSLCVLGITKPAADAMAKQPIILSCNFGERRPVPTEDDSDDSDDSDDEDDPEADESTLITGTDLLGPGPSLSQARAHTELTRATSKRAATCSKKGVSDGGGSG